MPVLPPTDSHPDTPELTRRSLFGLASSALLISDAGAEAQANILISATGFASMGVKRFRCAIGRGGLKRDKQEGDGATPIGTWSLREVIYRADRMSRPRSILPTRKMKPNDGWCDAPADMLYNQAVTHPFRASAERLWRTDNIYDLIVVVGYNDAPVV